jgi:hypothetical protein
MLQENREMSGACLISCIQNWLSFYGFPGPATLTNDIPLENLIEQFGCHVLLLLIPPTFHCTRVNVKVKGLFKKSTFLVNVQKRNYFST